MGGFILQYICIVLLLLLLNHFELGQLTISWDI